MSLLNGTESLLMEADILGLDSERFPTEDPTFGVQVVDVDVKMDVGAEDEGSEKQYVMIKMEDMMEEDVLLNNNNILLSPETMVSLLGGKGTTTTTGSSPKLAKSLMKVNKGSMRASQSQLHHLLTQRAASNGMSSCSLSPCATTTPATTTTVLTLTPGALNKHPSHGTGTLVYGTNWASNENKVRRLFPDFDIIIIIVSPLSFFSLSPICSSYCNYMTYDKSINIGYTYTLNWFFI